MCNGPPKSLSIINSPERIRCAVVWAVAVGEKQAENAQYKIKLVQNLKLHEKHIFPKFSAGWLLQHLKLPSIFLAREIDTHARSRTHTKHSYSYYIYIDIHKLCVVFNIYFFFFTYLMVANVSVHVNRNWKINVERLRAADRMSVSVCMCV